MKATTTKGEATRARIVEQAAPVFNQQGYAGASVADVLRATGLEKGGLYNHFPSKEALAVAAFEHSTGVVRSLVRGALAGHHHAVDRLQALLEAYRRFVHDPPFAGGCPILNTAVEADDANPVLRDRARAVMAELREGTVRRIVERGVERGELRPGTDPEQVATVVVAAIEGGIALAQLYGDPAHMDRVVDHLAGYVGSLASRRTAR